MSSDPRHSIQAWAALKSSMGSASAARLTPEEWWKVVKSPEVQAVSAAVRKALQELLRPLRKDSPEFRKLLQDFNAAIAAADAEIEAEFASRHLPAPKNIEDWEKLARIAGIPKDSIGGLTGREIYNQALEWAEEMQIEVERRKILAQMMAGAGVEIGAATPGHRQGEGKAGPGAQDTEADYMARLLSLCTNGAFDKYLHKGVEILSNPSLSSNEKLKRLSSLNMIPPNASARTLAKTLGVKAGTVKKLEYWGEHMKKRRSEDAEDINARQLRLRERDKLWERNKR